MWGKLREAYSSAMRRRKAKTKSGAAAERYDPWRLEKELKWIDEYTYHRV